ncbi:hypothetical protein ACP4OV_023069 [Aristida adscensionis]
MPGKKDPEEVLEHFSYLLPWAIFCGKEMVDFSVMCSQISLDFLIPRVTKGIL